MPTSSNLYELQIDREAEALSVGAKRYWDHIVDCGHGDTKVGETLSRRIIQPLADLIADWFKEKRGQHHSASGLISHLDPRELALLTVRVAIHQHSIAMAFQNASVTLGGYVEEHVLWGEMQKPAERKAYAKKVQESLKKTAKVRHKRAVVRHVGRKLGAAAEWTKRQRTIVGGQLLLRLTRAAPQYFSMHEYRKRGRTRREIQPTEKLMEWLKFEHDRAALLHPLRAPMVVPPKVWGATRGGGYITRDDNLVKNVNAKRLDALDETEILDTLDALNALQATAWVVNANVSRLASSLWAEGARLGGLPARESPENQAKPAFPTAPDGEKPTDEQVRAWKAKMRDWWSEYATCKSQRLAVDHTLHESQILEDIEKFYFVYTMDWRGRVYPLASHISPQGSDLSKALLKFAEGRRLGNSGAYWLGVHLANSFGYDKVSLDERVQWAEENTDAIIASAADPEANRFWNEADSPWQFLAACYEWVGYQLEGADYVCSLPVGVDGSCNGLQHFSAALKDEVGGSAVNLVPGYEPADIYQRVADKTTELLLEDIAVGANAKARYWLNLGIDRNLVKRPVMTLPYGVTAYGMRDQIAGELNDPERFEECIYLANLVEQAIADVVVAAPIAMKWLQDIAALFVEADIPIKWTTPLGFEVEQSYRNYRGDRIRVWIGGQQVKLTLVGKCHRLNKRKQISGISPNVVHSWDAAHMMHTVLKCRDVGLNSLAMVHDSYATTPGEVDALGLLLREAFVEQYRTDVLADFLEQAKAQLPPPLHEKLPALPIYGKLGIEQVGQSDYFFA